MLEDKKAQYIIGTEVGEQGTPHLQGYIEFKNAIAFTSLSKMNERIHWEVCRGSRVQNIEYCSKECVLWNTFPLSMKQNILNTEYSNLTWRPWQQEVLNLVQTKPDPRKIHWYWEPNGNSGKSYLIKYICIKHEHVIIATGKMTDVFNQINTYMINNPGQAPTIILLDIPRSSQDFINYGCIEQIKNGCLYSGKYEGGICIYPIPHIIIMANQPPDTSKMSEDRWDIIQIPF